MLIAIVNQSTKVTDKQAATMTQAVATQVRLDAAPIWDKAPAAVVFYTDPASVPATAHGIAIVDTIKDQPQGVLGFHTEDPGGKLWGIVACQPSLDAGAKVLTGDWAVSSILSHEVLEMFVDAELQPVGQQRRRSLLQLRGVRSGGGAHLRGGQAWPCPTS